MKFYTAKVICIELGIGSRETLDKYARNGFFPPYEQSPHRANGVGYFENTFQAIKLIELPTKGRPKK